MIDIYDEVGYIKNVLRGGLSAKWERDALLLARYYKSQGVKKSETKKKLKEKCENNHNNFVYSHVTGYKRLNKIIDLAYKKDVPLRQIKQIEISKEVLNWFLNLEENFVISNEQLEVLKLHHPKCTIKNHPITWKRTKMLFTLFIWTKIQENYLDKPNMHYLKKYMKRFKEDSNLEKGSFNINNEKDLLYELGFIGVNYGQGIDTKFMREVDVFQIPITDKNRILLVSEEAGEGDLYNCGKWLDKQKYGSFICQNCGKEFVHYNSSKQEKGRKYCKECSNKIRHNNNNLQYRVLTCSECGKDFKVEVKNTRSTMCYDCRKAFILKYDQMRKKTKDSVDQAAS